MCHRDNVREAFEGYAALREDESIQSTPRHIQCANGDARKRRKPKDRRGVTIGCFYLYFGSLWQLLSRSFFDVKKIAKVVKLVYATRVSACDNHTTGFVGCNFYHYTFFCAILSRNTNNGGSKLDGVLNTHLTRPRFDNIHSWGSRTRFHMLASILLQQRVWHDAASEQAVVAKLTPALAT